MIDTTSPSAVPRRLPDLASRLQGFGTTIFAEMSALALRTGSINLGQGFPDTDGPDEVKHAAIEAIMAGHNQYPPGRGVASLLDAVAEHSRRFYGLEFDPATEVLITAGATEAIAAAMLALCEVGDEVIMFEPYYDSYAAAVAMAGANRRVVPLRPPLWGFDSSELRAAVNPRTRLLLLNSPHNPTGKVFSRAELGEIAALCVEMDLLAVTDEVYEHLVFDGEHLPLSSFPGMADRTITVSSAGKTFSCTGWKIGWVLARPGLRAAVQTAKQFLTYVNGAPFQYAIAAGLQLADDYFEAIAVDLAARRDLLRDGLSAVGLTVLPTQGTFFLTTDISPISDADGIEFCATMPERCGVVAIPSSVFYDDKVAGRQLVRWTFCKRREVLDAAVDRLQHLRG